ncbi:MAG: hypothetical protein HFACDABA_01981 [Anaerolineales bacterium]|nr:hypothetical protein [Anaerolineales bacterium]
MFVYLVLAYLTFFPQSRTEMVKLPLSDHGSLNIILLAMLLFILLFVRWVHQIPPFFQWLLKSGRLESRYDDLPGDFERYLQDYQKTLLSKREPLFLSLVVLGVFIALAQWAGIAHYLIGFFTPRAVLAFALLLLATLLCLFMAGQAGWMSFVTGRQIGKLPLLFNIKVQPRHSDKCGGLRPLGKFCFESALPLIVAGLILAIVPSLRLMHIQIDEDDVLAIMSASMIFGFLAPLTVLAIFMPLWHIHLEMLERKNAHEDDFASRVMRLEEIIREHTTEKGDLKKAEAAKQKLEILQTINPDMQPYPVWPFNFTMTLLAALSPQIVQTLAGVILKSHEFVSAWLAAPSN